MLGFPMIWDHCDQSSKFCWISKAFNFVNGVKIVVVRVNSCDAAFSLLNLVQFGIIEAAVSLLVCVGVAHEVVRVALGHDVHSTSHLAIVSHSFCASQIYITLDFGSCRHQSIQVSEVLSSCLGKLDSSSRKVPINLLVGTELIRGGKCFVAYIMAGSSKNISLVRISLVPWYAHFTSGHSANI